MYMYTCMIHNETDHCFQAHYHGKVVENERHGEENYYACSFGLLTSIFQGTVPEPNRGQIPTVSFNVAPYIYIAGMSIMSHNGTSAQKSFSR